MALPEKMILEEDFYPLAVDVTTAHKIRSNPTAAQNVLPYHKNKEAVGLLVAA